MNKKKEKMDSKHMKCMVCGNQRALIHKYGLKMCRRCFRENAEKIGFKKYS